MLLYFMHCYQHWMNMQEDKMWSLNLGNSPAQAKLNISVSAMQEGDYYLFSVWINCTFSYNWHLRNIYFWFLYFESLCQNSGGRLQVGWAICGSCCSAVWLGQDSQTMDHNTVRYNWRTTKNFQGFIRENIVILHTTITLEEIYR